MPFNIIKEDLRTIKTERALDIAMLSLLKTRNFRKITVKDISDEALISRATFYAHFSDKYDFLKSWLITLKPDSISRDAPYEKIEKIVNQFVYNNDSILENLIYSADEETLGILHDFILSTLNLTIEERNSGKINPKYIVLSNFYVGGVLKYILWHIKNKFSSDVAPMNIYFYEAMENFEKWQN